MLTKKLLQLSLLAILILGFSYTPAFAFTTSSSQDYVLNSEKIIPTSESLNSNDYTLEANVRTIQTFGQSSVFVINPIIGDNTDSPPTPSFDCGNGVKEDGEECDGNDFSGNNCTTFGFLQGDLLCTPECTIDTSQCLNAVCGNGVKEVGEECDGNDFGGTTCETLGYIRGSLQCTNECFMNTTQCNNDVYNGGNGGGGGGGGRRETSSSIIDDSDESGHASPEEESGHPSPEEEETTHTSPQEEPAPVESQDPSTPLRSAQGDNSGNEEEDTNEEIIRKIIEEDIHLEKPPIIAEIPKTEEEIPKTIDEKEINQSPEKTCKKSFCDMWFSYIFGAYTLIILALLLIIIYLLIKLKKAKRRGNKKSPLRKRRLLSIFIAIIIIQSLFTPSVMVQAIETTPNILIYEGRLLDNNGDAINTAQSFRFSFWKSPDWITTDVNQDGSINTASDSYTGWFEVQNITPYNNGTFSIKLGSVTNLPVFDYNIHKYLQVEIKENAADDTAYQLMDPTADNGVDATDRQTIGSVPYAKNSEMLDNKQIGVNEDDIAVLGENGKWNESQIPGGTNEDLFILDNDNTKQNAGSGNIQLQFGNTLGKYLAYDIENNIFVFNDDVAIQGDLSVNGSINGINNLVGTDNNQVLTNKTIDGDDNIIQDISFYSLTTRPKSILLTPEFSNMLIKENGTNNIATIRKGLDSNIYRPYYVLTSGEINLQNLDVFLTIKIPDDFVSWDTTPIQLYVRSDSANFTDNQIDIKLKDSNKNDVTLNNSQDLLSNTPNTWEIKNITFSGSPTFTPGQSMILQVNMQGKGNNKIYIGEIRLNYNGR